VTQLVKRDMRPVDHGDLDSASELAQEESIPATRRAKRDRKGARNGTAAKANTKAARVARAKRGAAQRQEDLAAVSLKIADLPVITSKRWYVTLSAAIGIAGSIVSATYFAVDYGRIKPIERELEENLALLANAKSDALNAKSQLERAEQKSSELATKSDQPSQIFPRDRSSVVGFNISFLWDYGKHDTNTRYILELQDMAGRAQTIKVNVDRPETKSMFYAIDPASAGNYVWRVRPGRLVSEEEVGQGPWSPAAVFTIHPSVTERIRATNKLLVASTPTSYDVGVNNKGEYGGFEMKVLRWLLPRIAEKLNLKQTPALEVEEIAWNRLFNYMQNGEADIAVRSITRSEAREREYQNLKFTIGYALNHELFIQPNKAGTYPDSLRGKIVGTKNGSINESAAKLLAQRFGYTVNSSYTSYGDLLEGLRRGEVAYAVVDSLLVSGLLDKTVFALGAFLDEELGQFYRRELGLDREEYAILVHEGGSSELRTVLNDILGSDEYRKFAAGLKVELPAK
jgi:ABC-type amino acid transport substrate-binding protein